MIKDEIKTEILPEENLHYDLSFKIIVIGDSSNLKITKMLENHPSHSKEQKIPLSNSTHQQ